METPKKDPAQGTRTTLNDLLKDKDWLQAADRVQKWQREILKNHYYGDGE